MTRDMRPSQDAHTPDLQPRPSPSSSLARLPLPVNKASSGVQSSATWTSTSGDLGGLSDTDEIRERNDFVEEYNRLAKKYGIRPLVPDKPDNHEVSGVFHKRGWWSRTFRRTSSQSTEHSLRRQRSTSHVMSHLAHPKRDSLKDQDLQGLVRLCGKSFLYMPPEYAPGSLVLPTCFRATAQYLIQHAPETRGVFRIPGSIRVVNELYEFYCADQAAGVASTVRSPNLPAHINAGIHDVASCFKKFLSGLPGGILGSLSLFDAMIAINSQLYGDPEFNRTKQSKIRARLIALAIGTLRSQFRRELICAVFGLLCLLGRAAETAPREDKFGRPLPTSDLMGYNALGIVFGPLLVGDMLGSYAVKLADPSSGLFIVPRSPSSSKSQKSRKKPKESHEDHDQPPFLDVDKIHVANNITEMLVTNWRDVVRQMRSLDATLSVLRSRSRSRSSISNKRFRRSSSFGVPSENDPPVTNRSERYAEDRPRSFERYTKDDPTPYGRYTDDRQAIAGAAGNRAVSFRQIDSTNDALSVRKTRPTSARNVSNTRTAPGLVGALSPPREESDGEELDVHPAMRLPTPLKSSLKASFSKTPADLLPRRDQASVEDISPGRNSATPPPPPRSPSRVASGISPIKKHFESLEAQPRQQLHSPTNPSETRRSNYGQTRSQVTPTPTGTYRTEQGRTHHRAAPNSISIPDTGNVHSRQRASRSRNGADTSECERPRPRSYPTLRDTPRTEHGQPRHQESPTRSETYHSGYDRPRPGATPNSKDTPKPRTEYGTEHASNECPHRCTSVSSSANDWRSTAPRALTQVDGSPERDTQQPSCDLDTKVAYQARPGVKILKAPSTMRSQPKMSHVDPKFAAATLRSSVWRTSSRGSADSGIFSVNEAGKNPSPSSKHQKAVLDQIDGAADFMISIPSPSGSFIDLRGEFERRGVRDSHISSLPVLKSRSEQRAVLTKKVGQGRKSSWGSPNQTSPKLTLTCLGGVKPGTNKVMGLAAMFDTAAKASPVLPTPGGAVQKKRRETARVISPYTSNPSLRASLRSVASVSTPVSLLSPTRLSIHLTTPAESSGKKSMIPRLQISNAALSSSNIRERTTPLSLLRREESRFSLNASNTPSRLPTPSHLPLMKKALKESPPLPQFDGMSSTKQSLLKLTAQQEIRPVQVYSSPIPQTKVLGGYKGILRLSQSTSSRCSEELLHSKESTSLSPSPSRGRSASSLRDQVRSLRAELSVKHEDCSQLRLDLDESRRMKEVNDNLLRKDLDCAKSDIQKWRCRAERAERKVDKYQRLAMQIKDARDHVYGGKEYHREQQHDTADDDSFTSGSDHLPTSDRVASQPLTARMNQSVRRTPLLGANAANSLGTGDCFSERSSSTVVRTNVSPDENYSAIGSGLWSAVNELVDFASPGLLEEPL